MTTDEHEAEHETTCMIRAWLSQVREHRVIRPNETTEPLMPSHANLGLSAAPGCLKPQIFQPHVAYSPNPLVQFQAVATIPPMKKYELLSTALELMITPLEQSGLKVSLPLCHVRASIANIITHVFEATPVTPAPELGAVR